MPDTTNDEALSGFMGLPVVLARLKDTMAIPIYPELTAGQQTEVVEAIASFYA